MFEPKFENITNSRRDVFLSDSFLCCSEQRLPISEPYLPCKLLLLLFSSPGAGNPLDLRDQFSSQQVPAVVTVTCCVLSDLS